MTPASPLPAARTTDSSDRTVSLAARGAAPRSETRVARPNRFARRFLTALMRSLAAPHV